MNINSHTILNQFTQSQGNATATVAAIFTLGIVVIIMVGIFLAVQMGYKLAKSKKRYIYNLFIVMIIAL